MEIGNFCSDPPGRNPRCFHEERSHFGLWCMLSSPLILGFNMSDTDRMDRVWPIITNEEAIAIDHAWAGSPGTLHKTLHNNTVEIWTKPMLDHKVAVLVLNANGEANVTVSVSKDDVPGSPSDKPVRDVWNHKDVTLANGVLPLELDTHDSALLIFSGTH
jgi:alpha-galactosidase